MQSFYGSLHVYICKAATATLQLDLHAMYREQFQTHRESLIVGIVALKGARVKTPVKRVSYPKHVL